MNTELDEPKATLFDEYYLLKALFVILIYILFFLTVGLSIFFWLESGTKLEDLPGTLHFVELTRDEAIEVVVCWYSSIFIWGMLVYNNLRVWIVSMFAPLTAHDEYEMLKKEEEAGCCATCSLT
jgi:hypothetical protein